MKLGYARVSTDEQSLEVQREQLTDAGCVRVWEEKLSGKNAERPELKGLLRALECPVYEGGTYAADGHVILVVTKLDRLARNTRDLLEIIDRIGKSGAGFISLGEPWADTTSPAGRMVMTVLAGVAEFERDRILERTAEGRAHAKKRGVRFGRPEKLSKEQQRAALKMLQECGRVKEVARIFKVDLKTIRKLRDHA